MKYRYYYMLRSNDDLEAYLKEVDIPYESIDKFIRFNLWSSMKNSDEYLAKIKEITKRDPLIYAEFSEVERQKAEYLVLTPKRQIIDIRNEKEAFEYSCYHKTRLGETIPMHSTQVGTICIAKEPTCNSQTAFWSISTGFGEIFTDYRVKNLALNNELTGIVFRPVRLKNNVHSENIFQINSSNLLEQKDIIFGFGEKEIVCPVCGKKQYCVNSSYLLHLNLGAIDCSSDMYVTENIWGEGIAEPLYIISQKFYRLLKKSKFAGGVNFTPVINVQA